MNFKQPKIIINIKQPDNTFSKLIKNKINIFIKQLHDCQYFTKRTHHAIIEPLVQN